MLNFKNFKEFYGMLFFNITYKNETDITNDPKEIVLNYKLNAPPDAGVNYSIYSILFCERTVKVDVLGNELILIA